MMELVCGGTGDIQLNPSLLKKKIIKKINAHGCVTIVLAQQRDAQIPTPQQIRAFLAL